MYTIVCNESNRLIVEQSSAVKCREVEKRARDTAYHQNVYDRTTK
jgi:hypothetical protein